ncbi:EAL domain-containing protein [Ferrimonas lipolytica]|uniref:EAL domain-containing protein n=1 Tax=Ferrimonas lipolytica TaxID=2724191 RepID=A0A6H1UD58_9GAMM|nr:EAL domain-containing protein [Ferrimonas lipolytica]QIZ76778.1 EAL domain-containing protein [Ferrimonas lipolytica]
MMTLFRQLVLRVAITGIIGALILLPLSGYLLSERLQQQQIEQAQEHFNWIKQQLDNQWRDQQKYDLLALARLPDTISPLASVRLTAPSSTQQVDIADSYSVPTFVAASGLFDLKDFRASLQHQQNGQTILVATSNTSKFYWQWWQRLTGVAAILAIWMVVSFVCVLVGIRGHLSVLSKIAKTAQDLSHLKFSSPLPLPKSGELRRLGQAINTMSSKLRFEVEGYNKQVDGLKHALLTDQVSSLPNRAYIVERIDSWLKEADGGVLVLINMSFLDEVRLKYGFAARDDIVSKFAAHIRALDSSLLGFLAARISADEFLIVVAGDAVEDPVAALQQRAQQAYEDSNVGLSSSYGLGVVPKDLQRNAEEILAQADTALMTAMQSPDHIHWYQQPDEAPMFRQQWREALLSGIEQGKFRFNSNPVIDQGGDRIQLDLDISLEINGKPMLESDLMPYLKMLRLTTEFEQSKIRAATQLVLQYTPVVFGLPQQTVEDPSFISWLQQLLRHQQYHFQFEVTERLVLTNPSAVKSLRSELKNLGYKLGVNRFGVHLADLDYVSWLRPDYVKLDPAFVATPQSEMQLQMCRTMFNTLQTLNIALYLDDVPNDEVLSQFSSMPYNGFKRRGEQMEILLPEVKQVNR